MPRISPAAIARSVSRRIAGALVVGAIGDALEDDLAHQRRHGRELAGRAFGRFAHQLVDALESGADGLQLVPRRHQLAHRLQGARGQHVGGDQRAHRHAMIDRPHERRSRRSTSDATSCSEPDALVAMLARLLARKLVQADCSTRACQRFSTSASRPSALMVAALATVSVRVELLAASAWKLSSASRRCARWRRQRHADQDRNRRGGDHAQASR